MDFGYDLFDVLFLFGKHLGPISANSVVGFCSAFVFRSFYSLCLGTAFLYMLSGYNKSNVTNYSFAAMFVFLFCVAAPGVWEIYEFSGDMPLD